MELQHVNVKLIVSKPEQVDLAPLIPVFHAWIQNPWTDELLLDIADYRHVPAGPGVIVIGHQGDYSVDNTDARLGVRYNRKAELQGSNRDRLRQASLAALAACQRLENEPLLAGTLKFNGQDLEISFNDRLLAPNHNSTREALRPDLGAFLGQLFGGSSYTLSYGSDPRRLLTAYVNTARPFSATELLANLDT